MFLSCPPGSERLATGLNVDNSTVDLLELDNGKSTRSLCNDANKSLDDTCTRSAFNSNNHVNQVDAVTDNLYIQL